jgi:hypothetical protein
MTSSSDRSGITQIWLSTRYAIIGYRNGIETSRDVSEGVK